MAIALPLDERPQSAWNVESPHRRDDRDWIGRRGDRANDECEPEWESDAEVQGDRYDDGRRDHAGDGERQDRAEHRAESGPIDGVRGREDEAGDEYPEDEAGRDRQSDLGEKQGPPQPGDHEDDRIR